MLLEWLGKQGNHPTQGLTDLVNCCSDPSFLTSGARVSRTSRLFSGVVCKLASPRLLFVLEVLCRERFTFKVA